VFQKGFTLIEMVLVVAVLSILSAIAVTRTGTVLRRTYEARTMGNLATLRSAIGVYFASNEGKFPTDNLQCLVTTGHYLKSIPLKFTPPYHPEGNTVDKGTDANMQDAKEDWFYFNVPGDPQYGQVVVNCIHRTLQGRPWSSY